MCLAGRSQSENDNASCRSSFPSFKFGLTLPV
jgi:hypothetical protein